MRRELAGPSGRRSQSPVDAISSISGDITGRSEQTADFYSAGGELFRFVQSEAPDAGAQGAAETVGR